METKLYEMYNVSEEMEGFKEIHCNIKETNKTDTCIALLVFIVPDILDCIYKTI